MLRIHFTAEDLARIRIRADPHPLWEVLLSLHMLQTQDGSLMFGTWRRRARTMLPASAGMLTTLARPRGYSPDFLTPELATGDLEAGLQKLLDTPRRVLRAEIRKLSNQTVLPTWVSGIADGDRHMMRQLGQGVRQYYDKVLQPHWASICTHIRADRGRRAEQAMEGGFERVLNTLHPAMRWRAPVLEVSYPVDQDLHLNGRGLVLAPSFFCWQNPITLADPDQQPILLYPVERDLRWTTGRIELDTQMRLQPLVALLGRTRATVLDTIATTPDLNTTELARLVGISPAGASQHATVLRNAGLVTTMRHNGSAVHNLSPYGTRLLEQPAAAQGESLTA
ncbi:MAG: winged helix-turn-helix domain-containing protein [Kibdelosporangium sp.]